MYERILVPTDGSPTAEAAMEHALEIAGRYGAEVHVLHVISTRRYDTSIESAVAPLRERGEEYVERLAAAAADAGVAVTGAVEVGRPARLLLEYVDDHDVDLVVMGTRGRGGLQHRLLGSVAEYVVTHADVPVQVVPAERTDD
jgi:nucleotide-binding universal stress UspA family protein